MKIPYLPVLGLAALLNGCATADAKPGSALPVANQDTSALAPGNSPIENNKGMEGSGHYHRKVVSGGTTP